MQQELLVWSENRRNSVQEDVTIPRALQRRHSPDMNKLMAIIKREYLSRIKTTGFVVGTTLTPLLMICLSLLPALLFSKESRTDYHVVVLDQTDDVAVYQGAEKFLVGSGRFRVRREALNETHLESRKRELNKEIGEHRLNAYIVVPAAVLDEGRIAYHSKGLGDFVTEVRIENAFNAAVIEQRMIRAGVNAARVGELNKKIEMEKFNERGEGEDRLRITMAFLLIGILCLGILIYGVHVMSAVIEEKQSRIIELLLSSVRPFPLMLGKLVGVGLVGLTQFVVWAGCAVVLSGLAAAQAVTFGLFNLPRISVPLMIFFVGYFLLGYFLYASLYLITGAIVSNEEDGQNAQFPLMILILLAPVATIFVWRNPGDVVAVVVSLIPFFSPSAMFFRIAIQQPPWWQIALSFVLMIGTVLAAVWLAAKIYRMGALMYGKPPTLTELAKWVKYRGS